MKIRAYHGTPYNFKKFEKPNSDWGIFFSDNENNAIEFSLSNNKENNPNILKCELNVENPLTIDWENESFDYVCVKMWIKKAINEGHDCLIIENILDDVRGNNLIETQYVIFNPDKITICFGS
jgi:hypothetical protein